MRRSVLTMAALVLVIGQTNLAKAQENNGAFVIKQVGLPVTILAGTYENEEGELNPAISVPTDGIAVFNTLGFQVITHGVLSDSDVPPAEGVHVVVPGFITTTTLTISASGNVTRRFTLFFP